MRKTILLQRFLQGNNQFQDSQRCLSCFLINSNQRLFPSQSNNQLTHKLLVGQFINSCYLSALYYSENAKDAEETTSSSSQLIRKESNNSQTDNRTSNKTVKDSSGVLSVDEIYEFLIQENARDIVVIKLDKSLNYVDYFMVATANSSRHLAYMAESLNRLYKDRKSEADSFLTIEGKRTATDWQCIDFRNAVVHFMLEEVRNKYQLEKLWTLGPKFDDLTREVPSFREVMEKVSDQGLFELYDPGDRAEYIDDVEIVNPWEIEYKGDSDPKLDEDEDAYII